MLFVYDGSDWIGADLDPDVFRTGDIIRTLLRTNTGIIALGNAVWHLPLD